MLLRSLVVPAYFVIGFIQLFATIDGISELTGLGVIISVIIAFFLNWIPVIGTSIGVYGAMESWDWSLLASLSLFFWWIPAAIIISLFDRP
jgi:hypothetical protein